MPLLVQKFGGSSVANPARFMLRPGAIDAHRQGSQVVVVVSAGGDTTDELIAMARQLSDRPSARELDQLLATGEQVSVAFMAIAIESLGVPAISFTGARSASSPTAFIPRCAFAKSPPSASSRRSERARSSSSRVFRGSIACGYHDPGPGWIGYDGRGPGGRSRGRRLRDLHRC